MILVLAAVRFPVVVRQRREGRRLGTHKALFGNRTVILYFLGIFAYVGTEQGVANWISQFLTTYHGYDPQTVGAAKVALFWGLMTVAASLGWCCSSSSTAARSSWASRAGLVFLSLALSGRGAGPDHVPARRIRRVGHVGRSSSRWP